MHVITPTAHPLESLATSLTREGGPVSTTASLIDDLAADPRSLHLYARRMTHIRNAPRLLLVVDQFEELFTLCRSESERSAFIENLLLAAGVEMPAPEEVVEGVLPNPSGQDSPQAANPVGGDSPLVADQPGLEGPLVAVIALRADFYSHCAQYARLRSALSARQEYIGPMSPDELRQAIEQPAVQNKWEFEPGLVDLILHEVSDEPGGLPLLSHALLETWHRRRGRGADAEGLRRSGRHPPGDRPDGGERVQRPDPGEERAGAAHLLTADRVGRGYPGHPPTGEPERAYPQPGCRAAG